MKICYIANIRIPTEKAHGIQIMKMCEAFALLGHDIELIVPTRRNPIVINPFEFYEIDPKARERITIKYIRTVNLIRFGKVGFWFQTWWFAELASIAVRKKYPDVIYSRDQIVLINMFLIHKHLVWEAHRGETGFLVWLLLFKAKLVTISWGLADLYSRMSKKILVAPDGVDLKEFEIPETKEQCRKICGFSPLKKTALYWGSLYDWKGAQTLADAALHLTNYEQVVFVGGNDREVAAFQEVNKDNPHIIILGRRQHGEAPYFMKAAEVLVLPNSAKEKMSSHYTSPLKLFEYMASGTPIVASDLPSLREVLNEKNARFATADDPKSLHDAIKDVFDHGFQTTSLHDIEHYTWDKRAEKIAAFIEPYKIQQS